MGRALRKCPFCVEKRRQGQEVKQTQYERLPQHLKKVHGISAEEAKGITNQQKGSRSYQRSETNRRRYFVCNLNGCGRKVLDRVKHLKSTYHQMEVNDIKEVFQHFTCAVTVTQPRQVAGDAPLGDAPPGDAPSSPPVADSDSDSEAPVIPNEDDKPLMTKGDISFEKYAKLLPNRFRPSMGRVARKCPFCVERRRQGQDVKQTLYDRLPQQLGSDCMQFQSDQVPAVAQWHTFRTARAGGHKKKASHREDVGYVNRFLAHADFGSLGWEAITKEHVTLHDATLRDSYEAGSVGRMLTSIGDFMAWARNTGRIDKSSYGQIKMYIDGCKSSNAKEISIRTTARIVEEERTLANPDIYERFLTSEFVVTTKENFHKSRTTYLYDMAQVLIVLISMYNAPRPSVLANMRITDVLNATIETEGYHTITVGKHKTAQFGMTAHLTLKDELYAELVQYIKAIYELLPNTQPTAAVLRNTKLEECHENAITRMMRRAYQLAGIETPMNFGINRKLTTSVARAVDPSLAEPVARQLCHAVRTADQFYNVYTDRSRTAETVTRIEGAFATTRKTTSATITSGELEEIIAQETLEQTQTDEITSQETMEQENEIFDEESDNDPDYRPPSPKKVKLSDLIPKTTYQQKKPTLLRQYLSDNTKAEISAVYSDVIRKYSGLWQTIPIQTIRERREGRWPEMNDMKLRDAVRNLSKKMRRENMAMATYSTTPTPKPTPKTTNLKTIYEKEREQNSRRTEHEIQKEKTEALQYKILNHVEDGLEVQRFENTGRGVVATKPFKRGDFVVEYDGDLLDINEARKREQDYSSDPSKGNFMFFFAFKDKKYCIDATEESGRLGRLLNHSKTAFNCVPKTVDVMDKPCVVIFASRDIAPGEELRYDYGDRQKKAIELHPWLKH